MSDFNGESQVVSELYDNYTEVQKEILSTEIRKTRNKLFTIAIVIFLFDLLILLSANLVNAKTILLIIFIPAIITGLAFLSVKEPLLAMIITAIIIIGLWVYSIITIGGIAAISGWIEKAVIIYLLLAGFQNATEAAKIKKELRL
jgi:hypothetical protein